jgi:hypothetical protein
MSETLRQGFATELWQELVQEGGARRGTRLDQELESYLVFVLMRHLRDEQLAGRVLALELLEAMAQGARRLEDLRDVGDRCLIVAGLFPGQAERRRVSGDYFVSLGQCAYRAAAEQARAAYALLFERLAEAYEALVAVLAGVRELAGPNRIGALASLPEPTLAPLLRSSRRH